MSYNLPREVSLREDGPREGFQMHGAVVPTSDKVALINALSDTGIRSIEVTSFVRSDLVPQHADAEEVAKQFEKKPGIRYRALYLNENGFMRAIACPKLAVEGYILLAASETFLKRNNNIGLETAVKGIGSWLDTFSRHNVSFDRVMVSTAFGDSFEGHIDSKRVLEICRRVVSESQAKGIMPGEITFADTTGYANPESVRRLVCSFKEMFPSIEIGLHLHDTRGLGIANVYAGLQCGVTKFDCSVGGMGGCPFAKGAAGNVATEDVAFLCRELGIETGLDLDAYVACAKLAESIMAKKLPGKLKDAGLPVNP